MTPAESHYFTLMRAALWQQPVVFEGKPDWEGIMRIAKHQTTDVLVSDVALRLSDDVKPPEEMLLRMKKSMYGNLINQMELKQILLQAENALHAQGIEPILLKGFGLARLYPNPALRQFGDIDLFVGLHQFHQACTVLRGLSGGYNWGEEIEVGRHYNIEFGHHPMEIHRVSADVTDPKEKSYYATIEQDGLEENRQIVDFEGYCLSLPSIEFMVFFTFFHIWEHFLITGVGWRQISDLAMTLHVYKRQLEEEKLRSWVISMHLFEPWQAFGRLMVDYLGLPADEIPFYRASSRRNVDRLYDRIIAEGNFRRFRRFKQHKPKGKLAKKSYSFIGVFVDFFELFPIFPQQAFRCMWATMKESFSKNFQKN